jgi:hypothetical protein
MSYWRLERSAQCGALQLVSLKMCKYYSGDKIRSMRWAGCVAHMEEGRSARKVLEVKLEGKKQLGKSRSRWDEHIQTGFK